MSKDDKGREVEDNLNNRYKWRKDKGSHSQGQGSRMGHLSMNVQGNEELRTRWNNGWNSEGGIGLRIVEQELPLRYLATTHVGDGELELLIVENKLALRYLV